METPAAQTGQKWNPLDQSLFENRIIQISGGVDSDMADRVVKQLLAMDAADPNRPIYLFINSPGGEVTSGFAIYDTAQFIRPDIYTVVNGLAASMGSLIALCAKKERRFALPNSKFLIHQPLISGVLRGAASDLEIHAKDIIALKEKINRLYAQETGRPYEEIQRATDRDKWLEADEAQKFGLISKIVTKFSDVFKK
jgi:ATP-dependent Clp protease protease subunit